jgi:tetratricopeptide (TPR) repeat protein
MSLSDPATTARSATWVVGLVLLAGLLTPARAQAEQPPDETNQVLARQSAAESEQLATQGFEAYKAGDYDKAIQFYNQASEAHPAAALHYNVARIYETKLSAPDKAIEYYRKALKAPDVTDALAEKSLARIRVLSALLAQPNPPEEQAPPPEKAEEPQPQPAEHEPQAAASEERATSQRSTQKTIGYAVGITGLVAAGAGLGLGYWALVERNEARKTCDGANCTDQGGVDSMNTAHDLATASTITVAAGGALFAVGLGLVLFAPPRKSAEQDSRATVHPGPGRTTGPAGLQVAVTPTSGGAQVQLAGAFF